MSLRQPGSRKFLILVHLHKKILFWYICTLFIILSSHFLKKNERKYPFLKNMFEIHFLKSVTTVLGQLFESSWIRTRTAGVRQEGMHMIYMKVHNVRKWESWSYISSKCSNPRCFAPEQQRKVFQDSMYHQSGNYPGSNPSRTHPTPGTPVQGLSVHMQGCRICRIWKVKQGGRC